MDQPCTRMSACDALLLTAAIPICVVYWVLAHAAAWIITLLVIPSYLLAQKLYWACPFIPHIFKALGAAGCCARIGFEGSYCINFYTRWLTLPIRRSLPDFYIMGFPKCGSTSLAEHLKRHPAISGLAGLPYHETLSKESHFFAGVLGPHSTESSSMYRTFFPTIMHRWWAEVVRRVDKHMVFDACPVHACLPYVARRAAALTPDAKCIFMLRSPVAGLFSAENMFTEMGVPLPWRSLSEPLQEGGGGVDARFVPPAGADATWAALSDLAPGESLPEGMPADFYFSLYSHMRCAKYDECLAPFLKAFPRENIMIINFDEFVADTEGVVGRVLEFVGADAARFTYKPLPVGMKGNYRGRRMHTSVEAYLTEWYRKSVSELYHTLGADLGWKGFEEEGRAYRLSAVAGQAGGMLKNGGDNHVAPSPRRDTAMMDQPRAGEAAEEEC
ncbi:hypothetical protein FOA52_001149 [Chlamydomonas sp. UWO 241]|nr:hypothetical protein FOA52_001149 [Chlamydomonas sp. UWO 241]